MKSTEKISIGVILRVLVALIPIIFGMPVVAMVFCAYILSMFLLTCGPVTCLIGSLSAIMISMFLCGTIMEAGQIEGIYLAVEAILCALACSITIMRKKSFFQGVYLASIAYLVPSFINISQAAEKAGMSVAELLTTLPLDLAKLQVSDIAKSANIDVGLITELLNEVQELVVMMVPSVLVMSSVIIGYIMMWVIALPFRKNKAYEDYSFSRIKFPRIAVAIIVVAAILWMLVPSSVKYIFANIVFILMSMAFFSGMSLIEFFLRKKIINMFGRLAIHTALYMISVPLAGVSPFVNIFTIYTLIALVDSFVNIRKYSDKKNPENEGENDETKG